MRNKQSAFTLIETVVVIIILAILAVTVGSSTSSQSALELGLQTQQLQTDIEYLKAYALYNKTQTQVTFGSVQYQSNINFPSATPGQTAGPKTIILPTGITLTSIGVNDNVLTFNSSGRPETGATPALLPAGSSVTITLTAAGQSQHVVVYGQAGLVSAS